MPTPGATVRSSGAVRLIGRRKAQCAREGICCPASEQAARSQSRHTRGTVRRSSASPVTTLSSRPSSATRSSALNPLSTADRAACRPVRIAFARWVPAGVSVSSRRRASCPALHVTHPAATSRSTSRVTPELVSPSTAPSQFTVRPACANKVTSAAASDLLAPILVDRPAAWRTWRGLAEEAFAFVQAGARPLASPRPNSHQRDRDDRNV